MFFQPYRNYVITRQIYNERDFGQVYVKAWVRDAVSDEALLDGIEMTEATDEKGRFKYTYRMPADPSGNGRQLRIITVVYSDSGYTTRDVNYQVEETDVVVRDMNVMGHSGGGGSDIDYKKVREIVKEELGKLPPYPITDLSDIKKEVKDAQNVISGLIRGLPDTDLSPIEEQLRQLIKTIAEIPPIPDFPEQKEFDYSRLDALEKLDEILKEIYLIPKLSRLDIYKDLKKIVENKKDNSNIEALLNEILDKLDEN